MLPSRYKALTKSVFPGGFGSVQRVQDTYLDRVVLFKSMQNATDRAQLISEVHGLTRARSRHIVEIYDVIRDNQGVIVGIIIEYLTGRSYDNFHVEASADLATYLRTIYQIAVALRDMHAVGIVHRDIKLENFKDSASGLLKVFDFGISVASEDYKTKQNRGTFDYAAPELYVKDALITSKLDVYAWGVCAWKLATDTIPQALRDRPPQTKSIASSIETALPQLLPSDVVSLIDRSLSPSPGARPSSQEIASTLALHLVRNQHKGLFVKDDAVVFELSSASPLVRIRIGVLGAISVRYNGLTFVVEAIVGNVTINNSVAMEGSVLPNSCCLGFGEQVLGAARKWVTFSSSHPEVIL